MASFTSLPFELRERIIEMALEPSQRTGRDPIAFVAVPLHLTMFQVGFAGAHHCPSVLRAISQQKVPFFDFAKITHIVNTTRNICVQHAIATSDCRVCSRYWSRGAEYFTADALMLVSTETRRIVEKFMNKRLQHLTAAPTPGNLPTTATRVVTEFLACHSGSASDEHADTTMMI